MNAKEWADHKLSLIQKVTGINFADLAEAHGNQAAAAELRKGLDVTRDRDDSEHGYTIVRTQVVYWSEQTGELRMPHEVDVDPVSGEASGHVRYELDLTVSLTAEQCCGGNGSIAEILLRVGALRLPGA